MRSASTGTRALLQLLRKARRGRAGFTLIEALSLSRAAWPPSVVGRHSGVNPSPRRRIRDMK